MEKLTPLVFPESINEFKSFGRHSPPKPIPAFKKSVPILGSAPIDLDTEFILAPTFKHKSETIFINESLVAKKEFAAFFDISAESVSVKIIKSCSSFPIF